MKSINFLDFEVQPSIRQLNKLGEPVPVGARAFDLLLCLIENRDRVMARDELIALVWDGLAVGDNNLNVQVSTLRKVLGANAIITVPKRGLRFGLDVSHDREVLTEPPLLDLPDKPSIAVLPFLNLGNDADFGWFAHSISEGILTELSRFRDLFVVARNSSYSYLGGQTDARKISLELGVRYMVEGSVRVSGLKVRVSALLIDATSGEHIWAERFDRELKESFDVQDEITRAVVIAIAPQIHGIKDRQDRRGSLDNLSAYALAYRGWTTEWSLAMIHDRTSRDEASRFANMALEIDPESALAWRTLAIVHWGHLYHNTTDLRSASLVEGLEAANHAIRLDGRDHHAWRMMGLLHFMAKQPQAGLTELRRAHDINPNCAITLSWLGIYEATHGETHIGVHYAEAAIRLSPRDPSRVSLLVILGFTLFASHDYHGAVSAAESAMQEAPDAAVPYVIAAISYVGTGRIDDAHRAYSHLAKIAPSLAEARLAGNWLATNEDYLRRAHGFFRVAAGLGDEAQITHLL